MRNVRAALTFILGFAALGAAQAITFRYDETYTTQEAVQAQMEKHGGQLHQFRPFMGESISFGLAVTYGSELRTGAIGVYGVKGQKTDFGLWINEKGSYEVCLHGASDGSDFTRDTGISAKPNGTDVLSLALFHKDGDADGTGVYDLCLAINGKTVMELTDVRMNATNGTPFHAIYYGQDSTGGDVYGTYGEDFTVTYTFLGDDSQNGAAYLDPGEFYLTACDRLGIKAIPEPTALAFLALGAAGLALRRRVA